MAAPAASRGTCPRGRRAGAASRLGVQKGARARGRDATIAREHETAQLPRPPRTSRGATSPSSAGTWRRNSTGTSARTSRNTRTANCRACGPWGSSSKGAKSHRGIPSRVRDSKRPAAIDGQRHAADGAYETRLVAIFLSSCPGFYCPTTKLGDKNQKNPAKFPLIFIVDSCDVL